MLRNYLLMAWRQLRRNKLYSLINVTGLAVGMAVAMLIGLWIWDELTFNDWHTRHAALTRILSIERVNNEVTVADVASVPMEAALYSRYPSAFKNLALVSQEGHVLAAGDKKISQWGMWAQPSFPVMFSFRMVTGSVTAFKDPSSLLLSESAARALFGNSDALNQVVVVDGHRMRSGGVSEVTASSSPATDVENDMLGYDWKGRDPNSTPVIGTLFVGYDFGKTLGWQLKEGRDFSRDFPTDSGAFIINEAAARYMGLLHPVGEFIRWHDENHPIIGVIRDMVMKSPYSPVEPTFFTLRTDRRIHVITVRLNPGLSQQAALAIIQPVFLKYSPGSPFDYSFTEEDYAAKFRAEEQVGDLSGLFTVLALFISCLGLFGLASFVAEQRTR
jgi:hypothetical protein